MESLLLAAITMAGQIAPLLTSSTQVASVINVIATAAPLAISAGEEIYTQVKTAIDAVRNNSATTPEQQAQIDAVEIDLDNAYDAASAAAKAEDEAAASKI